MVKQKPPLNFDLARDKMPQYHIVLSNNDYVSAEYMVSVLSDVLHLKKEKAIELTNEVKSLNKTVVYTTHRELAELKILQLTEYCLNNNQNLKFSLEKE